MTKMIGIANSDNYFLVDDDFEYLKRWRWHEIDGYARRNKRINGVWQSIFVHREVMGILPGDPRTVDHINRDRLDNRRQNLRFVTIAENNFNTSGRNGSKSGHRGVHWRERDQIWEVKFRVAGKDYFVGSSREITTAIGLANEWMEVNVDRGVVKEISANNSVARTDYPGDDSSGMEDGKVEGWD